LRTGEFGPTFPAGRRAQTVARLCIIAVSAAARGSPSWT
jgi:hypothetical protein